MVMFWQYFLMKSVAKIRAVTKAINKTKPTLSTLINKFETNRYIKNKM